MGLLQELNKYFDAQFDPEGVSAENFRLKEEINELKECNRIIRNRCVLLEAQKDTALDEIASCQKRIDSLLRQLGEKNGGQK